MKKQLLVDLLARNIINNVTNQNKFESFLESNAALYLGVDPTFKSIHLGNYYTLCVLKRFENAGFQTFLLIGGATGMIGDPSGKKAERTLLANEVIIDNINHLKKQLSQLTKAKIINNIDFYQNFNVIDFLKNVGKMINVNYLLEKDIIKNRLETGISYTEFSYNLLQGYDFYYLYKNHNVQMQIGGSDQWGNITTGIEMIRKQEGENHLAFGLTINLLTKSDGTKFGKSEKGAIYLDANVTSPYEMYQFLLNQNDSDVSKLLYGLTFIDIEQIEKILEQSKANPSQRIAQKTLAFEVVKDIHGIEWANKCVNISQAIFSNNIAELNAQDLLLALSTMPHINVKDDINIIDLMINLKIVHSKSEARKLIDGQSISVNNQLVKNYDFIVERKNSINDEYSYLKKGKRYYYLIKWER